MELEIPEHLDPDAPEGSSERKRFINWIHRERSNMDWDDLLFDSMVLIDAESEQVLFDSTED